MLLGLALPWSLSALLQDARMCSSCFPAGLHSHSAGRVCLLDARAGELLLPWHVDVPELAALVPQEQLCSSGTGLAVGFAVKENPWTQPSLG